MRTIRRIVVHHSLTPDAGTVSWAAIRRYHLEAHGWKSIGYHVGIELVGQHYEKLLGRPFRETGAHAIGANGDSIGVCLVGDFTAAPPPDAQMEAAAELCSDLCTIFQLPSTAIYRHGDVSENRACPGQAFSLERLRGMVRARVG